jgi:VanZ family protein
MLFNHQDKLIHATAYAVMGLLVWRVLVHHYQTRLWLSLFSLLFCSLYGVSDEYHQSFIAGRDADVWDWLADTIGAGLMVLGLSRAGYKL